MRAHLLQHVPFEGLGSIAPWLEKRGCSLAVTRFYEAARLPALADVDLLIVMGGPMSVNDEAAFPWLTEEKRVIRAAIEAGKAVLGVCLGAQLIAASLGAAVTRNPVPEIGWFPLQAVPADGATFRFPAAIEVFHWHGETFSLPAGAVHLARSAACEHQAFQWGRSVLGLQFHLETTPESARELCIHGAGELVPAATVQSAAEILAVPPERYGTINALMADCLAYLCDPRR